MVLIKKALIKKKFTNTIYDISLLWNLLTPMAESF